MSPRCARIARGQITSSLADANDGLIGVGYLEASDVYAAGTVWPWKGGPTLAGNPLNSGKPTAVLVLPTLLGDTNLNGQVDLNDLGNVIGNYPMDSGATWETGDTNNDGNLDINDLGYAIGYYPSDMVSLGFWPADAFSASAVSPANLASMSSAAVVSNLATVSSLTNPLTGPAASPAAASTASPASAPTSAGVPISANAAATLVLPAATAAQASPVILASIAAGPASPVAAATDPLAETDPDLDFDLLHPRTWHAFQPSVSAPRWRA